MKIYFFSKNKYLHSADLSGVSFNWNSKIKLYKTDFHSYANDLPFLQQLLIMLKFFTVI